MTATHVPSEARFGPASGREIEELARNDREVALWLAESEWFEDRHPSICYALRRALADAVKEEHT
jgi:hypothetical protein